ncbi:hypothetical protein HY947_01020 [Candidatus Gottesmanbacteria bacterium]|nr:hypothetical protein [Candidatus Gottesmanbacteria bacterium]
MSIDAAAELDTVALSAPVTESSLSESPVVVVSEIAPDTHRLEINTVGEAGHVYEHNPPYDIRTLFGMIVKDMPGTTEHICEGIRDALQTLATEVRISGSAVTLSEAHGGSGGNRKNTALLEALRPFNTPENSQGHTLIESFYRDELDPEKLSPEAYTMFKLFQALRGPNVDIHLVDALGNPEETLNKVLTIFRGSITYPYDGAARNISVLDLNGRFKYVHIEFGSGGGINIIVYKDGNPDKWINASKLRNLQTQHVQWDKNGVPFLDVPNTPLSDQIVMTEKWDTLGDWTHQTARLIRSTVFHGLSSEIFDGQSCKDSIPSHNNDINFEASIGVMTNLVAAYYENSELTFELMKKSGLDTYLPMFEEQKARALIDAYKQKVPTNLDEFILPASELGRFVSFLGGSQRELFGDKEIPVYREYTPEAEANREISTVRDFAALACQFSPVGFDELQAKIPKANQREKVRSFSAGMDGFHEPGGKEIMVNLAQLFSDLSAVSSINSENNRARSLKLATEAVIKQFVAERKVTWWDLLRARISSK